MTPLPDKNGPVEPPRSSHVPATRTVSASSLWPGAIIMQDGRTVGVVERVAADGEWRHVALVEGGSERYRDVQKVEVLADA